MTSQRSAPAIPSMLWRANLRHASHHPWQVALTILGVALGVAAVVAIDLTNASARQAFELSTEALSGRATHHVIAGSSGVPLEVYVALRTELELRAAAPVVEGYARATDHPHKTLRILGIDPFAEGPLRPSVAYTSLGHGKQLARLLTAPRTALLSAVTARELGIHAGDRLAVRAVASEVEIEIVGLYESSDEMRQRAFRDILLVDIATAEELLERFGRLSRIDLRFEDGDEELIAAVTERLPPGADLVPAAGRSQSLYQMTDAFRLNLTALSLLALIVGMFLIYNTMTFSVVQRRTFLGTLRAVGVTRGQIFVIIIGEALLVGLIGTALGLALGTLLTRALLQLVTRTINDLYFVLAVRELATPPLAFIKGILLGIVATALAALKPALEATQAPPRVVMSRISSEADAHRRAPRLALIGLTLNLVGGVALLLPIRSVAFSFAALFAIIAGCALIAPAAALLLMRALSRPLTSWFGVIGRMAAAGVERNLSRTGVAISALMVAVSVTVGVGVMIHSFRTTVIRWLDTTLQADIYVSPAILLDTRTDASLAPDLLERLIATPGATDHSTIRAVTVRWPHGDLQLSVFAPAKHTHTAFTFKEGSPDAAWEAFDRGEAIFVTEPLSYRHHLLVGDRVELDADDGPIALTIAGVIYDYGSDRGAALINRRQYERHWHDRAVTGVAFVAAPGHDVDRLIGELRTRAGSDQVLTIQSNRHLKRASIEVFDRTFTITAVLRLLATGIAFIGVLSSLMALALERGRELAVLRANGMTPGQVFRLVLGQTALMGLAAGLFAIVVGLILAVVMIFVINRRSFGWSLEMSVEPTLLLGAIALAVGASVLAGLHPARTMARTEPALALREE